MKRISHTLAAMTAVIVLAASSAHAQGNMADPVQSGDNGDISYSDICECCSCGSWYGSVEATFFRYHRADGVRAGAFNNVPPATTDDIEFDFEVDPRITVGYVGADGLGARIRYWEYNADGDAVFPVTGVAMDVEALTIDFEVFQELCVGNCTTVEISAGLRYNEFQETMTDPIPPANRLNDIDGTGLVVGISARRDLNCGLGAYTRIRHSIVVGDKRVVNVNGAVVNAAELRDVIPMITELAAGVDYTRGGLTLNAGVEFQQWTDYSSAFAPFTTAPGNAPAQFAGGSDVGFFGFVIGGTFSY